MKGKERRCNDLFVHASHCGGGAESSREDGPGACGQERKEEMSGAFL